MYIRFHILFLLFVGLICPGSVLFCINSSLRFRRGEYRIVEVMLETFLVDCVQILYVELNLGILGETRVRE